MRRPDSTAADSQIRMVFRSFLRHRAAVVSLAFLGIAILCAALAPVLMPYDPIEIDLAATGYRGKPAAPGDGHILGTDDFGRDILSRILSGSRISLSIGFLATGISLTIGVCLGCVSGYFGGWLDSTIMRVIDFFLSIPSFFFILLISAVLPPNIFNIMIVIGVFGWMSVARLVRGVFLSMREDEFTLAAKAIGVSETRMIVRHLLPNAVAPIIVSATLSVPRAILTESSLSFLGFGVAPPAASWGSMLNLAKPWLTTAWWMWVPAGLAISLTVLSFNFVGDGLRDALDPLQHRR